MELLIQFNCLVSSMALSRFQNPWFLKLPVPTLQWVLRLGCVGSVSNSLACSVLFHLLVPSVELLPCLTMPTTLDTMATPSICFSDPYTGIPLQDWLWCHLPMAWFWSSGAPNVHTLALSTPAQGDLSFSCWFRPFSGCVVVRSYQGSINLALLGHLLQPCNGSF